MVCWVCLRKPIETDPPESVRTGGPPPARPPGVRSLLVWLIVQVFNRRTLEGVNSQLAPTDSNRRWKINRSHTRHYFVFYIGFDFFTESAPDHGLTEDSCFVKH